MAENSVSPEETTEKGAKDNAKKGQIDPDSSTRESRDTARKRVQKNTRSGVERSGTG